MSRRSGSSRVATDRTSPTASDSDDPRLLSPTRRTLDVEDYFIPDSSVVLGLGSVRRGVTTPGGLSGSVPYLEHALTLVYGTGVRWSSPRRPDTPWGTRRGHPRRSRREDLLVYLVYTRHVVS